KNWKLISLIALLVVSIGYHYYSFSEEQRMINYLFTRYEKELLRADSALQESLKVQDIQEKERYLLASHQALSNSSEIAGILGTWKKEYSATYDVKIYTAIPYDMSSLLYQSMDSSNEEGNLKIVSYIFKIYSRHIKESDVNQPEEFRKIYNEIHMEVRKMGLFNEEIFLKDLGV
ncbi:hypothetical protein, partial [Ammoniphilus sp. 3BR4]|uniref:hypothetical protein n=1 Tax=Ammoniphilus sp. 3BR4 TaxID=3158265 RepID=UPI003466B2CB